MRIIVIGTGYVGLVSGICYAKFGHDVLCIDKDPSKVELLQKGVVPIYEVGLAELLREQISLGHIKFAQAIPNPALCDVALIAVGTPPLETGAADLSSVFEVVSELAAKLSHGALLATKSTVPVGTAHQIEQRLHTLGRADVDVVSVPEFLREGSAIQDTLYPSRLVFGVPSARAAAILHDMHQGMNAPVVTCDRLTAEMIKYASNAFLATKISFINEIANICNGVGADVSQVAKGMGLDPRIGNAFLRAGLGYGGSCFPKDTKALVRIAGDMNYDFQVLRSVVEVNERQRLAPVTWLLDQFGDMRHKRVTLLGVAFKPGTDDIRESPAIEISEMLKDCGAEIQFCDPVVETIMNVNVERDAYRAVSGCDAVILVTEWDEFLQLDWHRVYGLMKTRYVFDGRNVLSPRVMESAGFVFGNIGHRETRELAMIG